MGFGIPMVKGGEVFKPFEQTFNYTGGVQSVTIPYKGLYQLEVWGAQGGTVSGEWSRNSAGGKGGYSKGYIVLTKGTVLYIVCGATGRSSVSIGGGTGGYNGGGSGGARNGSGDYSSHKAGAGGGGATHIAKVSGTLSSIGKTSFVTNGNGLIVAGGGGGGAVDAWTPRYSNGGTGGGINGGSGAGGTTGGTQSTGNAFGLGGSGNDQDNYIGVGGGGGGFYGGKGAGYNTGCNGGGGGSGWTGGTPSITYKGQTYSPSMSNGQRSGNGQAKITRVK